MNIEISKLCNELISALTTGLYEGVAVTAVLFILLKLTPRTNAATRHSILFSLLLLVTALPFAQLVLRWSESKAKTPALAFARNNFEAATMQMHDEPVKAETFEETDLTSDLHDDSPSESLASTNSELDSGQQIQASPPVEAIPAVGQTILPLEKPENPIYVAWERARLLIAHIPSEFRFHLPARAGLIAVGIWALISGIRLLSLTWQLSQLRRLKQEGASPGEIHQKVFNQCIVDLNLVRRPPAQTRGNYLPVKCSTSRLFS